MPIFLGGLNVSRAREAQALNEADRRRIEEAERRAISNVTQAWEQLSAARANIVSATAQVEANSLALNGVRLEAQLGVRTTLDVLDAEQEYLNAQVALANAERDARTATFLLLAAMGVLGPDIEDGGGR
jgi:outer membrane protein